MANTPKSVSINELDFNAIKNQFKEYLKSQSQFKDYDFEGSNMNVLLDVLSYNTFQNNFYTNMAINEMFLDSAVLRNSVISHAKELNYIPRSRQSAMAVVRVTINDENERGASITIPRFTQFSSRYSGQTFSFITDKSYIARKTAPGTFVADEVEIFEGEILDGFEKDGFFLDEEDELRANLQNENADIRTIEVFVDEEVRGLDNQFFYAKDIFGVQSDDKVFYLAPYFDGRYSVYFGRDVYGEQPLALQDIRIRYRVCSGEEPNGASRFGTSFRDNVNVTTITPAFGGAERESIESIRYFAPKSLQIQERAVTPRDYQTLLKQAFPEIRSVSVYGGDELDPPQFGKVGISVNLEGTNILSETAKNQYYSYISDKSPVTIEPIFFSPEFLYLSVDVNVYYDKTQTKNSVQELETIVRDTISNYSFNNLDDFGAILRQSQLSAQIDESERSFVSNKIIARPIIEYAPIINQTENPRFNFGAELMKPYPFNKNSGFDNYHPAIKSSVFSFSDNCAILQDDGRGTVQVISSDVDNREILNPSIGTVDYKTGEIKLVNFITDDYESPAICITARTTRDDIIAPKNRVFIIRDSDVNVNIIEARSS